MEIPRAPGRHGLTFALAAAVAFGCVWTDDKRYSAGSEAQARFYNPLGDTVFLPGCSPFTIERSLEGDWVDQGPPIHCFWEGTAVALESGETLETPFYAPNDSGLYRLRYEAGMGCERDVPLSEANCERRSTPISNRFEVERELCEPDDRGCRFAPAAPNSLCEDGVHYSGPAAECTRDPSSGRCGYEFLSCP